MTGGWHMVYPYSKLERLCRNVSESLCLSLAIYRTEDLLKLPRNSPWESWSDRTRLVSLQDTSLLSLSLFMDGERITFQSIWEVNNGLLFFYRHSRLSLSLQMTIFLTSPRGSMRA